jgi:hypothetical protein
MRAYFDDYGCMVCGKDEIYESNGMCLPCVQLIIRRLKTCVRRRLTERADDRIDLIMLKRKALATKLLGRFSRPWTKMSLRHRSQVTASLKNPVDEALGFITPGGWRDRYGEVQTQPSEEPGILGKSLRDMRTGGTSRNR